MEIKRNDLEIYKLVYIFPRRKLHQQQPQQQRQPPPPQQQLLDPPQIPTLHTMIQGTSMKLIKKQNDGLKNIIAPKFPR